MQKKKEILQLLPVYSLAEQISKYIVVNENHISHCWRKGVTNKERGKARDFPGSPVVKTLSFHCRGHGFDPWSGNQDPTSCVVKPK